MKKAIAGILALLLLLFFAACAAVSTQEQQTTTAEVTFQTEPPFNSEHTVPTPAVGELMQFGGYYWRVLELRDGKALLYARSVIDESSPYNETAGAADWSASTLRSYLNGAFYQSLDEDDRACIAQTDLDNGSGGATQDYIFPLSVAEVKQYFSVKESDDKNVLICEDFKEDRMFPPVHYYWLRDAGTDAGTAVTANDYRGEINLKGLDVTESGGAAGSHYGCIRPALWINVY